MTIGELRLLLARFRDDEHVVVEWDDLKWKIRSIQRESERPKDYRTQPGDPNDCVIIDASSG